MRTRLWLPLALAAAACSPEAYAPKPVADPTKIYWSIGLNHRAVTMSTVAPYDTIRLVATPLTIDGQPVKGLPAPTFTSLDLEHVQVGPNGLVRALGSGTEFAVVASLSVGNDTHADTAIINVTDTTPAPIMQAFSIQPPPGDSAKVSADGGVFIVPVAYDAAGDSIPNISAYFATSDSTIATIVAGGDLQPVRPGKVTVYGTATVYGVTKSDSVVYTIGYPLLVQISILPLVNAAGKIVGVFEPSHQQVGPGAVVYFSNANAPATDVTFDNPANVDRYDNPACNFEPQACGSGNIPAFAGHADSITGPTVRVRQFPVPGTYNFHSTISGATGSIQVMKQ